MNQMARQTTFYVDAAALAIVAARDGETAAVGRRNGRRSLVFRELLRRYDVVCRRGLPALATADWTTLLPVGESWVGKTDINSDLRMASLFTAAAANDRLLKRLSELADAERVALIDLIERYWVAKTRGVALPEVPGQPGRGKAARR
jgi:hypothetical protein